MRFALGFIEGPLHVPHLHVERFSDDEIVPVAAHGHPLASKRRLSAADLAGQPLLMREPGSGTRELIEATLSQRGIRLGGAVEFGNAEAIKQAAIHGGGIAFLPRVSITRELAARELIKLPFKELTIRRSLCVIRRATGYVAPAALAFLGLVGAGEGNFQAARASKPC